MGQARDAAKAIWAVIQLVLQVLLLIYVIKRVFGARVATLVSQALALSILVLIVVTLASGTYPGGGTDAAIGVIFAVGLFAYTLFFLDLEDDPEDAPGVKQVASEETGALPILTIR